MKNILFNIAKCMLIFIAVLVVFVTAVAYLVVEFLFSVTGFDTNKWHDEKGDL